MNEKPIIFNGDMINAILKGCKTQTRRVVRPQPKFDIAGGKPALRGKYSFLRLPDGSETGYKSPYGQIGDLLYVRESFAQVTDFASSSAGIFYRADSSIQWIENAPFKEGSIAYNVCGDFPTSVKWKPSIHMPKWASRIWLRVTDVCVERVNSITWEDVVKEGLPMIYDPLGIPNPLSMKTKFAVLWDKINASGYIWDKNPFVWVVSFDVVSTGGKP